MSTPYRAPIGWFLDDMTHDRSDPQNPVCQEFSAYPEMRFLTLGEGWHNNHHRFPRAARNGLYWWEIDPTWWTIRALAALWLAWDVQPVPAQAYDPRRTEYAA
jgi:hypothetical protein